MAAFNMNDGKSVTRERQEVRTEYRRTGERIHLFHGTDTRTEEERQVDNEARRTFENFTVSARYFI